MNTTEEMQGSKQACRRELLERRTAISETTRSAENATLRTSALEWIGTQDIRTVCAYVPVGQEPGTVELLDGLLEIGHRVLLPIVVPHSPLDWADYRGADSLRSAGYGLLEPSGDRLGAEAIGEADGLLCPALAVDRRGVRLGRGAGYYDRSLPMASATALLIGMVRDGEFVNELPGEAHDVRMSAVLTPDRGLLRLPIVT